VMVSHVRMTLLELLVTTHNLNRIVDIFVGFELSLDVHVAEHALFDTQSLSVRPKNSPVEWDGWKQCCRSLPKPLRCACIRRRS
jgi:hypothetical protein